MRKLAYLLLFITYVFLAVQPAFAEDDSKSLAKSNKSFVDPEGEIVISATRTPVPLSRSGGSTVEVITKEEIEESGKDRVEDLIDSIPGVRVSSTSSGPGSNSSVFVRGADSKNILVLIDGVMVNDPSTTNRLSDISGLDLEDIERIELIKGSQSVLYGSNATAGVINIITKKGREKPERFIKIEAGSYNTQKLALGASGKLGGLRYSVSASQTQSEGFSAANDRNDRILHDGNTDEKDGWTNQNLSLNLGYEVNPDFQVEMLLKKTRSDIQIDDNYWSMYTVDSLGDDYMPDPDAEKKQHNVTDQTLTGVRLQNLFFDGSLESTFGINHTENLRDYFDKSDKKILDYQGNTLETFWQGNFWAGDFNEISLGLSRYEETMLQRSYASGTSTTNVDKASSMQSLWVQDQMFLFNQSLILVLGGRNDSHDRFGSASTYRLAPSYRIASTKTLFKASYGTGFRAPSLYEQYGSYEFMGTTTVIGNQDLQAETSRTYDYGLEQELLKGKLKLGISFFDGSFENRIDYVTDPVTFMGQYENLEGTSTTKGYETFANWVLGEITRIEVDYDHTESKDEDGESLTRRPRDTTSMRFFTGLGNDLKLKASIKQVGKRKTFAGAADVDGNPVEELDAYRLVDLAASYRLNQTFKFSARIDNATDTFYEDAWSYAKPGRSFYLGAKASF